MIIVRLGMINIWNATFDLHLSHSPNHHQTSNAFFYYYHNYPCPNHFSFIIVHLFVLALPVIDFLIIYNLPLFLFYLLAALSVLYALFNSHISMFFFCCCFFPYISGSLILIYQCFFFFLLTFQAVMTSFRDLQQHQTRLCSLQA